MSDSFFPATYSASRARFKTHLDEIQTRWPDARLESYNLRGHPDLTQDWIIAQPPAAKRLLMLTTGEHGIEGFVGAAVLEMFVHEFLPRLNAQDTAILLFHAINPWGMEHQRRFNQHNVDINRNFITTWNGKAESNPEYARLLNILNPQRPLGGWLIENLSFYAGVLQSILLLGVTGSREAILRGQYRYPRGIYFGGKETEMETQTLMALQRITLDSFDQIVHLDMHTGYGPRDQMSIVNAPSEPTPSADCARNFGYPLVVRTDPSEFYSIYGDLTEFWHTQNSEKKQVYSAAFEFGTFGESLPAAIRSLRATIMENQLHWYGSKNPASAQKVRQEYQELFYPSAPAWRQKALADARQAFEGILKHYGFL